MKWNIKEIYRSVSFLKKKKKKFPNQKQISLEFLYNYINLKTGNHITDNALSGILSNLLYNSSLVSVGSNSCMDAER